MKVKIPKSQILRQLPDQVRAQVISCNDLPDYFVMDVTEIEGDVIKDDEVVRATREKAYEGVAKVLSPMEWFMFALMVHRYPEAVTIPILAGKLRRGYNNQSNNVAVHIKGIRAKLKKYHLPFDVEGIRGSVLGGGAYKLIKE